VQPSEAAVPTMVVAVNATWCCDEGVARNRSMGCIPGWVFIGAVSRRSAS